MTAKNKETMKKGIVGALNSIVSSPLRFGKLMVNWVSEIEHNCLGSRPQVEVRQILLFPQRDV